MPRLSLHVLGLSSAVLEAFYADESARRTQPLVAASPLDLRFGLVGAAPGLGCWGSGWPVVLERCGCQQYPCIHLPPSIAVTLQSSADSSVSSEGDAASTHHVATVELTPHDLATYQSRAAAQPGAGDCAIPCRLVILEHFFYDPALLPASSVRPTPGTVIAGVDQKHTAPSVMRAASWVAEGEAGLEAVRWSAVLDLRSGAGSTAASTCFVSSAAQFGLLHNLPALKPRPGNSPFASARAATTLCPSFLASPTSISELTYTEEDRHSHDCPCEEEGSCGNDPGPLLSLTFYANDPCRPYDRAEWVDGLPEDVREVVRHRSRSGTEPLPVTTVCYVTDVRPIPVRGSCWCPSNLPMPAPLEKQLHEGRKKRNAGSAEASPTSAPASPASRVSSEAPVSIGAGGGTSRHFSHRESPRRAAAAGGGASAFPSKTWCVRPLRSVRPVLSDRPHVGGDHPTPLQANRTQEVWTCLLNLRELEEFGIEVTVNVPYVVDGAVRHLKGTTVIFSGMLHMSTSGTVLLPVFCPSALETAALSSSSTSQFPAPVTVPAALPSLWVPLYVQYLLIFPLTGAVGCGRPLEMVRSCETYAALTVPTLIGHRGLGKTSTRSPVIDAAGAVVPLVVKCTENSVAAFQAAHRRGCAMVELDVMLSADRVPVVIHDPLVELLALKRGTARGTAEGQQEFAPVKAAVHKLDYTQLRDLHAQCCKTLGRVAPLKDFLMHHWTGLMRWTSRTTQNGGSSTHASLAKDGSGVDTALLRADDFPEGIASLREVLACTSPSLRINLEVKYPFQPRTDSNLFLQSDAFEVNGFVDAILRDVFAAADQGRAITFSSFDPNICLALSLKQGRHDVFFLSDTNELRDLKDYRSFHIEGAIQFAGAQYFAGVSINAWTLLSELDTAALPTIVETPVKGTAPRGPVPTDFYAVTDAIHADPAMPPSFGELGRAMVSELHRRHLKVWTWGGANSYLYFAYVQAARMGVDGVIGDRMPVFPSDEEEACEGAGVAAGEEAVV